jgi:membrane-bound lytic murein transglycosylase A
MRIRVPGAAALLLILAACATPKTDGPIVAPPAPAPVPAPAVPPVPPPSTVSFADLPGWESDDHAAALEAWRATCGVSRDQAAAAICRKARALGPVDAADARAFLEANFRPVALQDPGLLTAYFAPQYEARFSRREGFTAPVRGRPADLDMKGSGEVTRTVDGRAEAYPDRAAIEATEPEVILAWMRPEDLFFLQIQGSGILVLPDGTRKRAAFAAHNGQPFLGIARPMRERGLLKDSDTSGDAIRRWLAEHRGPEADEIMRLNPRYVFFRMSDDDGKEASGAAGVPLPAGRAIAVDLSRHDVGELFWIDASAPILTGAFPTYRRLTVALDTGGAIKGEVRADLYIGSGDAAGVEAGRVRHTLRMWRLVPVATGG